MIKCLIWWNKMFFYCLFYISYQSYWRLFFYVYMWQFNNHLGASLLNPLTEIQCDIIWFGYIIWWEMAQINQCTLYAQSRRKFNVYFFCITNSKWPPKCLTVYWRHVFWALAFSFCCFEWKRSREETSPENNTESKTVFLSMIIPNWRIMKI